MRLAWFAARRAAKVLAGALGLPFLFALVIVLMVLWVSLAIYGAMPEEPAIGIPKETYQKAAERWSGEVVSRFELERPHRLAWGLLYAVDFFGQKDGKVTERRGQRRAAGACL